jgi:hypothetical protein
MSNTGDNARSTLLGGLLKRRLLGCQFTAGTTFLQQDEETARNTKGSQSQASLCSLNPLVRYKRRQRGLAGAEHAKLQ